MLEIVQIAKNCSPVFINMFFSVLDVSVQPPLSRTNFGTNIKFNGFLLMTFTMHHQFLLLYRTGYHIDHTNVLGLIDSFKCCWILYSSLKDILQKGQMNAKWMLLLCYWTCLKEQNANEQIFQFLLTFTWRSKLDFFEKASLHFSHLNLSS